MHTYDKITKTEKILDMLQGGVESTVALMQCFLTDRHTSSKRLYYLTDTGKYGPKPFKTNWAQWYRERRCFYTLLNTLKRDGLVQKTAKTKISSWSITASGTYHLKKIQEKKERNDLLFAKKGTYQPLDSLGLTLVIFDIPERDRRKRDWLRYCLRDMNFKLLQKSVWIAKNGVHTDFIKALNERKMLSHVHIFSIEKEGTIYQVKL